MRGLLGAASRRARRVRARRRMVESRFLPVCRSTRSTSPSPAKRPSTASVSPTAAKAAARSARESAFREEACLERRKSIVPRSPRPARGQGVEAVDEALELLGAVGRLGPDLPREIDQGPLRQEGFHGVPGPLGLHEEVRRIDAGPGLRLGSSVPEGRTRRWEAAAGRCAGSLPAPGSPDRRPPCSGSRSSGSSSSARSAR